MLTMKMRHSLKAFVGLVALTAALHSSPATASGFAVTPLVSNQFVEGANPADGQLLNPWGLAFSATSPFWIADNNSGFSTLYNSTGTKLGLVVTIPPPAGQPGPAAPSGLVFNGTSDFKISVGGVPTPAAFIFSTEDGTIAAWAGGTVATLVVDRSARHAVYKGLALASIDGTNFLLATDFHNQTVDVFDTNFNRIFAIDHFDVPHDYAPFGIATLGSSVYLTFAVQNNLKHDDVAGLGHGIVEAFNTTGLPFFRRVTSHGLLNSPWGLAIAPASFGSLAGSLLVGNFGDGFIHAYSPSTGALMGTLTNTTGAPIDIDRLWAIVPGNDHAAGSSQNIYFTAGPNDEANGLFGSISPSP